MKLFISYAHANKTDIKEIMDLLRTGGHQPWYDSDLIPGTDWKQGLYEQIKIADAIIAIITQEFIDSDYCRWEIKTSRNLKKPVIPVLLKTVPDLPENLSRIQWVDFTEGVTNTQLVKLITALQKVSTSEYKRQSLEFPQLPELTSSEDTRPIPIRTGGGIGGGGDMRASQTVGVVNPAAANPVLVTVAEGIQERVEKFLQFYYPQLYTENDLLAQVNHIKEADLCLFDVSEKSKRSWLELGVALAMGKKIVLLADKSQKVPALFDNYRVYSYDTEDSIASIVEGLDIEALLDNTPIRTYCYFCKERTCKALSNFVDNRSYLISTDNRMLWRMLLQELKNEIQKRHDAYPSYGTDVMPYICEMRTAVTKSSFVLAHLDYVSEPMSLMLLGMAIGHAKPWYFIVQEMNELSPLLSPYSQLQDHGIEYFKEEQLYILDQFLEEVYPSEISAARIQNTADATPWHNVSIIINYQKESTFDQQETITGTLRILHLRNKQVVGTYFLHPTKLTLTFGRDSSADVILTSTDASRKHFRIFGRNNRYFIQDLESRNHTFLNGKIIKQNVPHEIFFSNTIKAAGQTFVIWDDRPLKNVKDTIQTGETSVLGDVMQIDLDVVPPKGLMTLHHLAFYRVNYRMDGATAREVFQIQAYYPLKPVLDVLVKAFRLEPKNYGLRVEGKFVDLTKSPMDLGLKENTVFELVEPISREEECLRETLSRIVHCENDLSSIDGERQYKEGFDYVKVASLYDDVYFELFRERNGTQLSSRMLAEASCSACGNRYYPDTLVAVKAKARI